MALFISTYSSCMKSEHLQILNGEIIPKYVFVVKNIHLINRFVREFCCVS